MELDSTQLKNLIRIIYGITNEQYELFLLLSKEKTFVTIRQICDKYHMERTGVQKKLNVLFRKNLVLTRQQNMTRGYSYLYATIGRENLAFELQKALEDILKKII